MNLGKSIEHLRINKKKQNQDKFANNIGITQTYLSLIENGHKKPSTDVLEKIADYIEIPLPVLFWYSIDESDIRPEMIDHFRFIKPTIDEMINSLFV